MTKEEFEEDYTKCYERVKSLLYKRGIPSKYIEDITQEAFLRAFKYLKNFEGRSELYTYVCRIAINWYIQEYIRKKSNSYGTNIQIREYLDFTDSSDFVRYLDNKISNEKMVSKIREVLSIKQNNQLTKLLHSQIPLSKTERGQLFRIRLYLKFIFAGDTKSLAKHKSNTYNKKLKLISPEPEPIKLVKANSE